MGQVVQDYKTWRHTDFAGIAVADYRASVLGTEDTVAVGTEAVVAVGTEVVVDNQGCTTDIPPAVVEAKGLMQRDRGSGCAQGQNHSRTGCWTVQLESQDRKSVV